MKNIQILDCTLRDGGRVIDCAFNDNVITDMVRNLTNANIDIVEVGFLRGRDLVMYQHDSTFFTKMSQIAPFLPENKKNTMYVAFADYNMYDFSYLEECDNSSVSGIRVGFTKKQFDSERKKIRKSLLKVKEQGYRLFVQGVNTLSYSDKELLELVEFINEIEPYSFGIVDTYGAMYLDDMVHYYNLIDYNLDSAIHIDIHSHNNFQLSFAFAQEVISLAYGRRKIILDATLNGMGKCAGNLNTELIVDYLARKKHHDYDIDIILDIIDRYLYPLKKKCEWGYSVPAFMAGLYKAHPNNIIYLTEKYRLNSKDIKYIVSGIEEETRQRYDYDNIQKVYKNYCKCRVNDEETIEKLSAIFKDREILVLAPGTTVKRYQEMIVEYVEQNDVLVVCVNFVPTFLEYDYLFYANTIHWEKISKWIKRETCIVTSNIHVDIEKTLLVDYTSLIMEDSILYDNSTIMLLNLLKKLQVKKITLAGFDGLKWDSENYINDTFPNKKAVIDIQETNGEIKNLFDQLKKKVEEKIEIEFLTPSIYEDIE